MSIIIHYDGKSAVLIDTETGAVIQFRDEDGNVIEQEAA